MMTVLLLSGPNLKLLGIRPADIYGSETVDAHDSRSTGVAGCCGV